MSFTLNISVICFNSHRGKLFWKCIQLTNSFQLNIFAVYFTQHILKFKWSPTIELQIKFHKRARCYIYRHDLRKGLFQLKPCYLLFRLILNRLFIPHTIKTALIKIINQELITFNEPIIYFHLTEVNLLALFLVAKHISK